MQDLHDAASWSGVAHIKCQMSLVVKKKRSSGFPTRSDTNRAVQSLNMARGLKFRIQKVEELIYPCSENKGADHLRLCFRICKKLVFSRRGSNNLVYNTNL